MKETPIIYNSEMVRARLAGRKTMTRRVVKSQPFIHYSMDCGPEDLEWKNIRGLIPDDLLDFCPYGQPGDRLWMREALIKKDRYVYYEADNQQVLIGGPGINDGAEWEWKRPYLPARFMPCWACRIVDDITNIRVERLQEITEEDAKNEGIIFIDHGKGKYGNQLPGYNTKEKAERGWTHCLLDARHAFGNFWNSLYAKKPEYRWEANPWVWVLEFGKAPGKVLGNS